MNFAVPRAGNGDLLTRTTLQIDTGLTTLLVTQMTQALQRVPGVLLAEVNADGARAVVAHDSAVPAASLVAAAARAGVQVKVLGGSRASARIDAPASGLGSAQIKFLLMVAALAFVSLALVDIFLPSSAERRFASIVISAFWIFFFAQVIVKRRS